jgi:hypothetical protein
VTFFVGSFRRRSDGFLKVAQGEVMLNYSSEDFSAVVPLARVPDFTLH